MGDSQPSFFDRGAAAFLSCFQTLTLLRPAGRNREGGAKVSVGIHTVSVAEKAKYRLVIRYDKKKRRTAWKKVATRDWDFTAEFAECVPEDKKKVRLELQKKKKCKVRTVGVTTVDPTQALQADGSVRAWYIFDPPKNGTQDRNVSLVEATVAVNGRKVERKTTEKKGTTTKPSEGNEKPQVRPVSSTELNKNDVTVKTTSLAVVGAKKLDQTGQGRPPLTASGDNTGGKPASSSPSATSSSTSSTTNSGQGAVRPSRVSRLFGFITKKNGETATSGHEGGTNKPSKETKEETVAPEDGPASFSENKKPKGSPNTASKTVEGEKPDRSGQDKPAAAPSNGDETHCKSASSSPNDSRSSSPSCTSTTAEALAKGGVRPSRTRQLFGFIASKSGGTTKPTQKEVNAQASDVTKEEALAIESRLESSSEKKETKLALKSASQTVEGENPGKRGQDNPTASPSGFDECTQIKTASSLTNGSTSSSPASTATDKSLTNGGDDGESKSERPSRFRQLVGFIRNKDNGKITEGGGKAVPTAKQSPQQFTDPVCMDMMSSIHKLWAELLPKRAYSKELLDYANSLRSRLEAAAPHTRDNTILNNLAAKVPDYTHYELPEMYGLSLHELNQIHKTVVFLLEDEEKRATYIRRWVIDDICRVALEEAPQVLETTAPC
ncbi:Hypp8556 [Branchiostoma lanceolatum]|uniref:Hypp8556 protein n=1 Tax=Branchiostoma lanceolatum TaxID=7740 RepID=A0A8J9Z7H9_BRALA|nr:Hypp8556 [Branchiostoma lanceolatum]